MSTFKVQNLTTIVLGEEAKPTFDDEVLSSQQRKALKSWNKRHDIAENALLSCLDRSERNKTYECKSAAEIWKGLQNEYGKKSDILWADAFTTLVGLQRDASISVDKHIERFVKLERQINGNAPANQAPLPNAMVNLMFIHSLGSDWTYFQKALGDRVHTMMSADLYAKVSVQDKQNRDVPENIHPGTKANVMNFQPRNATNNNRRGRYQGGRCNLHQGQRWHSVEPGSVNAVPETEPNDNIAIPIRKLRECM